MVVYNIVLIKDVIVIYLVKVKKACKKSMINDRDVDGIKKKQVVDKIR
jgi:hypothetical protein